VAADTFFALCVGARGHGQWTLTMPPTVFTEARRGFNAPEIPEQTWQLDSWSRPITGFELRDGSNPLRQYLFVPVAVSLSRAVACCRVLSVRQSVRWTVSQSVSVRAAARSKPVKEQAPKTSLSSSPPTFLPSYLLPQSPLETYRWVVAANLPVACRQLQLHLTPSSPNPPVWFISDPFP